MSNRHKSTNQCWHQILCDTHKLGSCLLPREQTGVDRYYVNVNSQPVLREI